MAVSTTQTSAKLWGEAPDLIALYWLWVLSRDLNALCGGISVVGKMVDKLWLHLYFTSQCPGPPQECSAQFKATYTHTLSRSSPFGNY